MMRQLQRLLSAVLSSSLIILSPGLAPYAFAGSQARATGAAVNAPVALPTVSVGSLGSSSNLPAVNVSGLSVDVSAASLPGVSLPAAGSQLKNAPAQSVSAVLPSVSIPGAQNAAAVQPGQAQQAAASRGAVSAVKSIVAGAAQVVENAVRDLSVQNAAPSSAYAAGGSVQNALTGELFQDRSDSVPTAHMGNNIGDGFFFARPAGDSIREANEAQTAGDVPPPTNNNNFNGGGSNNGGNDGPGSARIPLAAKIVSAAVALAPIALIAWPLIAAGSTLLGGLIAVASLGYAAFPFMSPSTPKLVRSLPGVAVGALGLTAVAVGLLSGGLALAGIGALAAFGGWGLIRWAGKTEKYVDETEVLFTMLGMLGAVAAVGLFAAPAAGALIGILKIAAPIASLPLLMHLPGWIGDSISHAFEALYRSARQSHRVATSVRRDTSMYERLTNYSAAALNKSSWNILWLGLVIWTPVIAIEIVKFVVGVAVGLVSGVAQIPGVVAWTISHRFAKDSALTKRLAYGANLAARLSSKAGYFNRMEAPFIDGANSESFVRRALSSGAILGAQIAWMVTAPIVTAGAALGGWLFAGKAASAPYDPKQHDPSNLEPVRDTASDNVPSPEKPKTVPGSVPARIMASAIGFVPFILLTMPAVWGAGLLGLGLFLTGVTVALMPLMPANKLPNFIAKAPGDAMTVTGLFAAIGAARYMLIGLPAGGILGVGIVAFLAGLGLRNLVSKLRDPETNKFDSDDWQYSLGYVGALGTTAALSIALFGGAVTGGLSIVFWGGLVTSLALLAHLPSYLWTALGETFVSVLRSVGQAWKSLGVWSRKTSFSRNLTRAMGGFIERYSVFSAPALLPFFVPLVAVYLLQAVSSLALGLALGLYHAPGYYVWSANYARDSKSRITHFFAGFNRPFYKFIEGGRKSWLEPAVEKLRGLTDDKGSKGWPTIKAYFGMLLTALLTIGWLAQVALAVALTPVLILAGLVYGAKAALNPSAGTSPAENPDNVF